MRKLLLIVAGVSFAFMSQSCKEDNTDDILIGVWKARKISFDGETYDYNDPLITGGCDTDILTLAEPGWAYLQQSTQDSEGDCVEDGSKGAWDTTYVYFAYNPRRIISSHKHELVLTYPKIVEGEQRQVTVTYEKE